MANEIIGLSGYNAVIDVNTGDLLLTGFTFSNIAPHWQVILGAPFPPKIKGSSEGPLFHQWDGQKWATTSGYVDVNKIESWNRYGQLSGKDYKYVREKIKNLAANNGWNNLTLNQKTIAANWFAVNQSKRSEIYTIEEQVQLGLNFHLSSIAARELRFRKASMEVYNRLPKTEVDVIVQDIKNDNLAENYIQYGVEGTNSGDPAGLFDYVNATLGTIYQLTGIAAQDIHPIEITKQRLISKLIDIVKNGNYI